MLRTATAAPAKLRVSPLWHYAPPVEMTEQWEQRTGKRRGMRDHRYHVDIMTSRSRTLYIGFTSALEIRVQQHKDDIYEGFSKQYQCHRLVYFETYDDVQRAIGREKQLKRWSRANKLALITQTNPAWADLSEDWGKPIAPWREPAGLSATAAKSATSGRDDISVVIQRLKPTQKTVCLNME